MVSATPRRAGAWQEAQPASGRPAPVVCCAWSNLTLKLRSEGKPLTGGFADSTFVWQIVHIGWPEVTNCWKWQLVQDLCPGKAGCGEFPALWWHEAQATPECAGSVCEKLVKAPPCAAAAAVGLAKEIGRAHV